MATAVVQYGGKQGTRFSLETNEDLVVIRTQDRRPVAEARLSGRSRRLLDALEPVAEFEDAGVEVFHVRSGSKTERDEVRSAFAAEPDVRFAGRVLADPVFQPRTAVLATTRAAASVKRPVVYSENLFVKFEETRKGSEARRLLADRKLKIKRAIEYLPNAYFVAASEGIGLGVFDLALELLEKQPSVELCHPELLRTRQFRGAYPQQWHLKAVTIGGERIRAHADAVKAWRRSRGRGVTIAVIDTGIDIDHEEFRSRGKIVAPLDATAGADDRTDPRPRFSKGEEHGTACAGVACADGRHGASGVAPAAKLMPIRQMSALGSQSDADAIAWAADHGADVISISWGPDDGDWSDPTDPLHRAVAPLPDSTRLAIDYALTRGRRGKGCVVCWAAGNGNESVDDDRYASHLGVIAVAACNDRGTRSVYSDTGKALWCAFPSDDAELDPVDALPRPPPHGGVWDTAHPRPRTPGIWTTDVSGRRGYNRGGSTRAGDVKGHYANDFGGTSSATPGVAGVAALVLSVNPALRRDEVREILRQACERIAPENGRYDPATGHSPLYGYGRVNAARAVALAGGVRVSSASFSCRALRVPPPRRSSSAAVSGRPTPAISS
jgi:subtilisin family serine protease